MEISIQFNVLHSKEADLILLSAFQKKSKNTQAITLDNQHWPANYRSTFEGIKASKNFRAEKNESFLLHLENGQSVLIWGMGEKSQVDPENLRKLFANAYKSFKSSVYQNIIVDLDHFNTLRDLSQTTKVLVETFALTNYFFDKYISEKPKSCIKTLTFHSQEKKDKNKIQKAFAAAQIIAKGVNLTRDLVNEPPNVLNSVKFALEIEKDIKMNFPQVKVKILDKAQIKKERMHLLLAVNQGSAFEPRVVHLHYKPKKVTAKTQHVALVGKGLTFDSGGYSLKQSASMMGMKFDMAGAATVYAAFRNAIQFSPNRMISCYLGITDNMVSPEAITPDTIIRSRSGLQVEILNTDAEGRLVLADILDYACDANPNIIIDAATLTGACIRALGTVCGVMGNNKGLVDQFLKSSESQGESSWYLPIFEEYREDMKSKIGDIKNIGGSGNAGAQKAAAFLEKFIRKDISWIHLDIAGVADSAAQLPYCPQVGATGLMVRTLTHFLLNE